MNHSNLWRRIASGVAVVATLASITFSSCTKVDNTLGSDLTLSDQGLKLGQMNIGGRSKEGENYFKARLFKSDSINSSNQSELIFGTNSNDTFGLRTAGFFAQYMAANLLDEDEKFGFMPIFDSAMLYLSIKAQGGDSNFVQRYEVFEVVDNSFLTESSDTTFFTTFNIDPYIASEPIFTFDFPNQERGVYTTSTQVKLDETAQTAKFVDRLMLKTIDGDYDHEIYTDDEAWVKEFKGLYVRPVAGQLPASGSNGAVYTSKLDGAGFGIYGRNRVESDPSLIKDTIGMTYTFYSQYAKAGNVSINTIENDYSGSLIDITNVKSDDNPNVGLTSTIRVEGMAGVVTEITLAKELFYELDTILESEEAESGELFTSLFFNQAMLKIYMEGIDGYDPTKIDPMGVTPWMNYMPSGLGLYTNYSNYTKVVKEGDYESTQNTLVGIPDYPHSYEDSYTLDFGGEMNRSWGCYVMNVSSYIQTVWNNYLTAKEEANGVVEDIDWDSIDGRRIYLAPYAKNLFSAQYASLQAGDADENSASMLLDLTYTMIR